MTTNGEDNAELWYAYHIFHKCGLLPFEFSNLSANEKGIVMAFIDIYADEQEKQYKKMG